MEKQLAEALERDAMGVITGLDTPDDCARAAQGPSIFRDPRSPLHAIDARFPRGFVPTHQSPAPRSS